MDSWLRNKNVLVTGGTSGLGKALVTNLLDKECNVISVARNGEVLGVAGDRYSHLNCDFSDFSSIKDLLDLLAEKQVSIDILINNAGILSPPKYQKSKNGIELSFQVNFLSHVFLTRELIRSNLLDPACIVNISSPIHTMGKLGLSEALNPESYRLFQAYANSKLYMALFSQHLVDKGYRSFSFNPGTFSSGIYRHQRKWFHLIYRMASPFMISSKRVALGLSDIIEDKNWVDGKMMNRQGNLSKLLQFDGKKVDDFWLQINQHIDQIGDELRGNINIPEAE